MKQRTPCRYTVNGFTLIQKPARSPFNVLSTLGLQSLAHLTNEAIVNFFNDRERSGRLAKALLLLLEIESTPPGNNSTTLEQLIAVMPNDVKGRVAADFFAMNFCNKRVSELASRG